MGAIMESAFCIAYLIAACVLGVKVLKRDKLFGALTLTLAGGDAFHLVPRIYGNLSGRTGELTAALGFGTFITSVTMTVFYALLYLYIIRRFGAEKKGGLYVTFAAFAAARIVLCVFPQNEWFTGGNLTWGIIRNVPFVIAGAIIVYLLYAKARGDKHFKFAWLAVTLSFLFYIPVVLFADALPIVGMLMLPKTACYVWLIVMGYRRAFSTANN